MIKKEENLLFYVYWGKFIKITNNSIFIIGSIMMVFDLNEFFQFVSITIFMIFGENMINLCYLFVNEYLGEEIRIKSYPISKNK